VGHPKPIGIGLDHGRRADTCPDPVLELPPVAGDGVEIDGQHRAGTISGVNHH
jgi:hypothetical protein